MRFGAGVANEGDGKSASTEMPVVFGDNGVAMIGAGKVWRFMYVGVRWVSVLLGGGLDGLRSGLDIEPVGDARPEEEDDPVNEVGEDTRTPVGEETLASSAFASLTRSSHFPRTVSRLLVTRCEGVQRRVEAGVADEPVGWARMLLRLPDWELLRERSPPPLREDVRSRRRVW